MKISTSDRQNDRHSDKIESPLCCRNHEVDEFIQKHD